eukprot:GHRQ01000642.1.p4 GENE.GHRQ01000642.1~~GHRQ01000642.1.p4  ORF type:complete len:101 (-),score=23.54 GHRQ01000642.1:1138-1440(-)
MRQPGALVYTRLTQQQRPAHADADAEVSRCSAISAHIDRCTATPRRMQAFIAHAEWKNNRMGFGMHHVFCHPGKLHALRGAYATAAAAAAAPAAALMLPT